jgi:pseudaminic acid synthase
MIRKRSSPLGDSMRKPTLVAEVSGNHGGSLSRAIALIEAVAATGVSHIKFQTYTPDTMTINHGGPRFSLSESHSLWGGRNLYSLYEEAHTPWEWHGELFAVSREHGLIPFSTPFDSTAVDFLESLEPELYKVASMEIGDTPLIRRIAETGRPIIISTGTATLAEVDDAVEVASRYGCGEITLLLCTSSYPALPSDAHLSRMAVLRDRYHLPVGLSDHTLGIGVSLAAAALGASVIERHVTIRRSEGGPDAAFSLEPAELAILVAEANAAFDAIGSPDWSALEAEAESRRFKRSLYLVRDCVEGEALTRENVRAIRPAGGLAPKHLEAVLGRRLAGAASSGTPLSWDLIAGGEAGGQGSSTSVAQSSAGSAE